jgi:TolA-binding protein
MVNTENVMASHEDSGRFGLSGGFVGQENTKMRKTRLGIGALAVAAALLFGACAGSQPLSTREEGTGIGGLVGAGTGAIVGAAVGHPLAGAAIGGGLGAGTGFVVGNEMQNNENANTQTQSQIQQQQQEIEQQRRQIEQMQQNQDTE